VNLTGDETSAGFADQAGGGGGVTSKPSGTEPDGKWDSQTEYGWQGLRADEVGPRAGPGRPDRSPTSTSRAVSLVGYRWPGV